MAEPLDVNLRLGWAQRRQLAVGRFIPAPKAGSQQVVARFDTVYGAAQSTMGRAQRPLGQYLSQGKGFDGTDAPLFGPDGPIDGQHWLAQHLAQQTPHQFRLTLSLPHNPPYFGWRAYVESVMRQTARVVDRPLNWMAAIHRDTDHTHAHIIISGHIQGYTLTPGDLDHDLRHRLYLTPDFYKHGMRHLASHIATKMLGPVLAPALRPSPELTPTQAPAPRLRTTQDPVPRQEHQQVREAPAQMTHEDMADGAQDDDPEADPEGWQLEEGNEVLAPPLRPTPAQRPVPKMHM